MVTRIEFWTDTLFGCRYHLDRVEGLWPFATKSLPEPFQNLHEVLYVDCSGETPVDVNDALCDGLALLDHFESGVFRVLLLSILSLYLWIISVDPAFITGHQRFKYSYIRGNELKHLPAVTSFCLLAEQTLHKFCLCSDFYEWFYVQKLQTVC